MADDAKALIELATRRFVGEVPALEPIKLVVGVELRGSGDVQQFRLEMPEVKVTKGPAGRRARARGHAQRVLQRDGSRRQGGRLDRGFHLRAGQGIGPRADPALIVNVVERQQERERTPKARRHA